MENNERSFEYSLTVTDGLVGESKNPTFAPKSRNETGNKLSELSTLRVVTILYCKVCVFLCKRAQLIVSTPVKENAVVSRSSLAVNVRVTVETDVATDPVHTEQDMPVSVAVGGVVSEANKQTN
jgi:hypothetical protein